MYFPKEVGARYPEVHYKVCLIITIVSAISIAMVSNYKAPDELPKNSKLKRSKTSLAVMTPAKRERLSVLSKNYLVRKVNGDMEHPPNPEPEVD